MSKISIRTRLYLTLIGVNLDILALFFFIVNLLDSYGESLVFLIVEISFVLIGSLMIFIGLFKGLNRITQKKRQADQFEGNKSGKNQASLDK
jgi:hypothetical protein